MSGEIADEHYDQMMSGEHDDWVEEPTYPLSSFYNRRPIPYTRPNTDGFEAIEETP